MKKTAFGAVSAILILLIFPAFSGCKDPVNYPAETIRPEYAFSPAHLAGLSGARSLVYSSKVGEGTDWVYLGTREPVEPDLIQNILSEPNTSRKFVTSMTGIQYGGVTIPYRLETGVATGDPRIYYDDVAKKWRLYTELKFNEIVTETESGPESKWEIFPLVSPSAAGGARPFMPSNTRMANPGTETEAWQVYGFETYSVKNDAITGPIDKSEYEYPLTGEGTDTLKTTLKKVTRNPAGELIAKAVKGVMMNEATQTWRPLNHAWVIGPPESQSVATRTPPAGNTDWTKYYVAKFLDKITHRYPGIAEVSYQDGENEWIRLLHAADDRWQINVVTDLTRTEPDNRVTKYPVNDGTAYTGTDGAAPLATDRQFRFYEKYLHEDPTPGDPNLGDEVYKYDPTPANPKSGDEIDYFWGDVLDFEEFTMEQTPGQKEKEWYEDTPGTFKLRDKTFKKDNIVVNGEEYYGSTRFVNSQWQVKLVTQLNLPAGALSSVPFQVAGNYADETPPLKGQIKRTIIATGDPLNPEADKWEVWDVARVGISGERIYNRDTPGWQDKTYARNDPAVQLSGTTWQIQPKTHLTVDETSILIEGNLFTETSPQPSTTAAPAAPVIRNGIRTVMDGGEPYEEETWEIWDAVSGKVNAGSSWAGREVPRNAANDNDPFIWQATDADAIDDKRLTAGLWYATLPGDYPYAATDTANPQSTNISFGSTRTIDVKIGDTVVGAVTVTPRLASPATMDITFTLTSGSMLGSYIDSETGATAYYPEIVVATDGNSLGSDPWNAESGNFSTYTLTGLVPGNPLQSFTLTEETGMDSEETLYIAFRARVSSGAATNGKGEEEPFEVAPAYGWHEVEATSLSGAWTTAAVETLGWVEADADTATLAWFPIPDDTKNWAWFPADTLVKQWKDVKDVPDAVVSYYWEEISFMEEWLPAQEDWAWFDADAVSEEAVPPSTAPDAKKPTIKEGKIRVQLSAYNFYQSFDVIYDYQTPDQRIEPVTIGTIDFEDDEAGNLVIRFNDEFGELIIYNGAIPSQHMYPSIEYKVGAGEWQPWPHDAFYVYDNILVPGYNSDRALEFMFRYTFPAAPAAL